MSKFEIRYEAKMPPTRKFERENNEWMGTKDRAHCLADAMADPGNWASDVVVNGKKVTWTTTYPDGYDLTVIESVRETMERVGYHGSDTVGPKSRKATLCYSVLKADGWTDFSTEYVCEGAW